MSKKLVQDFDNMIGYVISINDERDTLDILLAIKDMWPKIHEYIKQLERKNDTTH